MSHDNEAALRIYLDHMRKDEPDNVIPQILELLWEKIDYIERRLEFFNGHVHRGTGTPGRSSQTSPPVPNRNI